MTRRWYAAWLLVAALSGNASASTFSNTTPIAISGTGSSSGSQIFVQGFGGPPTSISVGVTGLSHTHAGNLGLVLVGPTGAALVLQGACGGSSSTLGSISLVFSDGGPASLPQSSSLTSGT